MKKSFIKNFSVLAGTAFVLLFTLMIIGSKNVSAGSYNGADLAQAILKNQTALISSSYTDSDQEGHRQSIVLSSLGIMQPTNGTTFALFSTGVAGRVPVTTDGLNPGDERGTWFRNKYGHPRDSATLTLTLKVPMYMHYLYYDAQFFSAEYPEYVGSQYNDKFSITVNSPSKGVSKYTFDVNSGYFVLNSNNIPGTGFDIFARSGKPADVDIVDRIPRTPGADAGASDLITIGGVTHPVSPNETITITIRIEDVGDSQFDSGAYIDNLRFSGFAKTEIAARKTVEDINGGEVECNDTLRYRITISNTGTAQQNNNPGNEFEDYIPNNTTYVAGSAYSQYGTISYDAVNKKITWNGAIPAETSRILEFNVTVNASLPNGLVISNQGHVNWDSDENGINDAIELTDDIYVDDGIDQDGDGETDDDDPTNIVVFAFDHPASVTEDFSDDQSGGNATQFYLNRRWFEANEDQSCGSCFEVAPFYHYITDKSFKTKIRQSDGPQYWNYYLSALDQAQMKWWEIWFACGDTSEDYTLYLNFKNTNNQDITKIKLDYTNNGTKPMDWVLELFYWDPAYGWVKLSSNYAQGYLRNDWYKLRIEKNGTSFIDYELSRSGRGVVDFATAGQLAASFSNFEKLEWISGTNPGPEVCPMFFWDEHSIGLSYQS